MGATLKDRMMSLARRPLSAVVAAGALGAFLSVPLLSFSYVWDQGVFGTLAREMTRGAVLYRDVWEHKPPGILWTYYAAFLLMGPEVWAVRVLEVLSLGLTSAGLVCLGRRWLGSSLAGLVAASLLPIWYLLFGENTAQAETFQLPLLVGSLALWPPRGESPREARLSFASGLLMGAAALWKSPALLFVPVLIGHRLLGPRSARGAGRVAPVVAALAGVAALPAATVLYYASRGAFAPMVDALVLFIGKYASVSAMRTIHEHVDAGSQWTRWLLPGWVLPLVLLGAARGLWARRAGTIRILGGLGVAFAMVAAQAKYFPYHHIPLLPFLCLLGAAAVAPFPPNPAALPSWRLSLDRAGLYAAAGLLASAGISMAGRSWEAWRNWGRVARYEIPEGEPPLSSGVYDNLDLARLLRARSEPSEALFIWGDRPTLYFMAGRRPAGPYCHLIPAIPPWAGMERLEALIRRLRDDRPKLILVCQGDAVWWRQPPGVADLLALYPLMTDFIRAHYRREGLWGTFELWTRRE
jgi:hypothetical protein